MIYCDDAITLHWKLQLHRARGGTFVTMHQRLIQVQIHRLELGIALVQFHCRLLLRNDLHLSSYFQRFNSLLEMTRS